MSVLVVGGDRIDGIKAYLKEKFEAGRVIHFSGRKLKHLKNGIPKRIDLMVILTDYVSHDLMAAFKNTARKKNLPFICTHSVSHFRCCLENMKSIFV